MGTLCRGGAVLLVLVGVAVGGCARIEVRSQAVPGAAFSQMRTYAWLPDPRLLNLDPLVRSEELDARIRAAVDRELAAKGYRTAPADAADVVVRYSASLRQGLSSKRVREGSSGDGSRGSVFWRPPGLDTRTYDYDYEAGSLVVDVLRPGGQDLLWRGGAQGVLDESASREERRKRLDETIVKIMSQFPPP